MDVKEDVVEQSRGASEEFKRLEREHRELDKLIGEKFGDRKFLSPEEDLEKSTLKKQKLALKDRMQKIQVGTAN